MKRRIALSLLGLSAAMLLLGTNAIGHKAGSTPVAEAAAYSITVVDQQCLSTSAVRVVFTWGSYNEGNQWMDLSLTNNDFVPGTFVGVGPIPVGQNTFTWDGHLARPDALPARQHPDSVWVVNQPHRDLHNAG